MHGFFSVRVQWILIYLYVSAAINLIKTQNIFTTREISLLCMWSESRIEKCFSNGCVSCCSQVHLLESRCRAIVEWDLPGPDFFFFPPLFWERMPEKEMRGRVENICNGVISDVLWNPRWDKWEYKGNKRILKIVPVDLKSKHLWSWDSKIHDLEK